MLQHHFPPYFWTYYVCRELRLGMQTFQTLLVHISKSAAVNRLTAAVNLQQLIDSLIFAACNVFFCGQEQSVWPHL